MKDIFSSLAKCTWFNIN